MSKTVSITLLPQTIIPSLKTFTLTLASPAGGASLGSPSTATVSLVPTDNTAPTVAITAPKLGTSIKSPAVVKVSCQATDNIGVARVTISVNDRGAVDSVLQNGVWALDVNPVPGLNTIVARSIDAAGNVSPPAFTQFTYVVKSALTATVSDPARGSIKGLLSGPAYQEGSVYKLTAVAKPGFYLSHWSANQGDLVGANQPTVTFVMSAGLQLKAWFVPNPYLDAAGAYTGLITAVGTPTFATTGAITLNITSAGSIGTGAVKLGAETLSLGIVSFTSTGDALFGATKTPVLTLKRKGKPDIG